ncbi:cysteine--tRNA ligase [Halalkalicoccus sp. NIPERK01]|uniref:cysteine--tRNA ligase n=1 Tax=Halalkalicoccus sp. NIPERK01 TaxID=3053469 RepID=UPI00256EC818|nr:cysteine--tRNA ligase [Halalkalicoccus sp. NIPERK01]MDL5361147.1 cysteine--tRNA ligase [Halalkalicoccus sp. NIPERK01]
MLSVTNTLSGEREEFRPTGDEVLVYVCGLTVSDDAHLGHARVWVHADVMCRWLEHEGHPVRHVENFTDVNEKIAARIGEDDLGESEREVARRFIERTIADMRGLNLQRATVYPRVSEHIPEIIELVERLIESGHAYEADGSVYFDVTTFEKYGKLSNQRVEDLEAQGDPEERSEKRHPADFALWKAGGVSPEAIREHEKTEHDHPPGGETWDSPWGEGRPGWHIECSAMAMTHLDETIDVHVGGHDLVFPHHENEIAQSEAATGQRFAEYWLHTGLLETEGEKMSSSLGNFFTVSAALEEFGPDVLRSFYLSTEYGSNQTFSEGAMVEARERFERLERAYERATEAVDGPDARTKVEDDDLRVAVEEAREGFARAMNDDFGVREAMTALLSLAGAVNRHVDSHGEYDYRGLRRAIEAFEELGGGVFGFSFGPEREGEVGLAEDLVDLVLRVREEEREAGNYERADRLRDDLAALGIDIEDEGDETTYRL